MRVRLVRRPGQHGTKPYVEQYGDRLICVRYRYDEAARRRYKTIELIVEEAPWEPDKSQEKHKRYRAKTLVGVRILYSERALQQKLRDVRAIWIHHLKIWQMPYGQAITLGLADRIVGTIENLIAAQAGDDSRH